MTVTVTPVRPRRVSVVRFPAGPAPVLTRPTFYRLANPWVPRLVAASVAGVGAIAGSLAGVAVFRDATWLDAVAGVALAAGLLVAVLGVLVCRYWRRAPMSAWVPSADPNRH